MLARCLLVLAAGLVAAQLLSALPLDSSDTDTLLQQESEQLSTSLESSGAAPVVREKRTIGFLRQAFPTLSQSADENAVAESKVAPVVVRNRRQAPAAAAAEEEEEYEDDDQAVAASDDNEVAASAEEGVDDSESAETEDQRDKRSGLGGGAGSGGGSGNFLFDIIRLVAGSGTTQSQDEADNAPLDENSTHAAGEEGKHHDDGYSAGVPGPLTRLFVIANRGIANLIQDLILRLAQTSERIVNFKARLITSII